MSSVYPWQQSHKRKSAVVTLTSYTHAHASITDVRRTNV